jgi:hypothetical protein
MHVPETGPFHWCQGLRPGALTRPSGTLSRRARGSGRLPLTAGEGWVRVLSENETALSQRRSRDGAIDRGRRMILAGALLAGRGEP